MFTFIIHRYIISLSSSRLCLPPCQCLQSLQVSMFQSAFMTAPVALTSDTAASASSSTPVLPASYFVRDSEQITASVLQEGPRASQSSLLAETILETQDTAQTPDVTQSSDVSQTYTVSHKKPCHFVFDNNSGVSWSIFILFAPVERGRNTLHRS